MATENTVVRATNLAVVYQAGYAEEGLIAEPAIILRKYDSNEPVYGICQGDQEIVVGGLASLRQLRREIAKMETWK